MAAMVGVEFAVVTCFAPHRGLVAAWRRRHQQRWVFAQRMLTIHLLQHEGRPNALQESHVNHLQDHLQWDREFAGRVVEQALQRALIARVGDQLELTETGREVAREAIVLA